MNFLSKLNIEEYIWHNIEPMFKHLQKIMWQTTFKLASEKKRHTTKTVDDVFVAIACSPVERSIPALWSIF